MTTKPARLLWLDPSFGASGDMMLGALIGLGASASAVEADLGALAGAQGGLSLDSWRLDVAPTDRAHISATRASVTADQAHQPARTWLEIDTMIATAELPDLVRDGARLTFRVLAQAEAAVHSTTIESVHFHEVGAVDSIVDTVGAWSALNQLGVSEVGAGPVGLGYGQVKTHHGLLPVPAPATIAVLDQIPIKPVDYESETVTPTGAALLSTMVTRWGPIPAGRLAGSARGAGGRNPHSHPNVLSAFVIESLDLQGVGVPTTSPLSIESANLLATNIDDASPEILGHTLTALVDAGASDAWLTPTVMKKSRPAHELKVLCPPALTESMLNIIMSETGSLGVRVQTVAKHVAPRHFQQVMVGNHEIGIKVGPYGVKPEHDDVVVAAKHLGRPVRVVSAQAVDAYLRTRM